MDPRKQKRLGPAPIASFEKSFEDSLTPLATATTGSTAVTAAATSPSRYVTNTVDLNTSTTIQFGLQQFPTATAAVTAATITTDAKDINRNGEFQENQEVSCSKYVNIHILRYSIYKHINTHTH